MIFFKRIFVASLLLAGVTLNMSAMLNINDPVLINLKQEFAGAVESKNLIELQNVIDRAKKDLSKEQFANFFLSSIGSSGQIIEYRRGTLGHTALTGAIPVDLIFKNDPEMRACRLYILETAHWAVKTERISGKQLTQFINSMHWSGYDFFEILAGQGVFADEAKKFFELAKLAMSYGIGHGWYEDEEDVYYFLKGKICPPLVCAIYGFAKNPDGGLTMANKIIDLAVYAVRKGCLTREHFLALLTTQRTISEYPNVQVLAQHYGCHDVAKRLDDYVKNIDLMDQKIELLDKKALIKTQKAQNQEIKAKIQGLCASVNEEKAQLGNCIKNVNDTIE